MLSVKMPTTKTQVERDNSWITSKREKNKCFTETEATLSSAT